MRATSPLLLLLAACGLDVYTPGKGADTGPSTTGEAGGGEAGSGGGSGGSTDTGGPGDAGGGSSGGGSGGGSAGGGSSGGGSSGGSTGADPVDISIDSITPTYGTNAGGTEVTITGGPFDDTAVVRFGSQTATVTPVDLHTLVVTTPAYASTGAVAVEVETATGYGVDTGAFTYWADGTGKAAVIGALIWDDTVGSYWSDTQEGYAYAYFIEPQDVHWWQFAVDTFDSCENYTFVPSASAGLIDTTGLNNLHLAAGAKSLDLTLNSSTGAYENTALTTSNFSAGATYNLTAASAVLPPEDVAAFAKAGAASSITSPNISGATPPTLSKGQTFTWSSSAITADWIFIEMYLINSAGTGIQDGVVCVARNDGNFTVTSSKWSSWVAGRQVNVFFGPTVEATGVLPWNNGESRMAGTYYIIGAGFAG